MLDVLFTTVKVRSPQRRRVPDRWSFESVAATQHFVDATAGCLEVAMAMSSDPEHLITCALAQRNSARESFRDAAPNSEMPQWLSQAVRPQRRSERSGMPQLASGAGPGV